MLSKFFWVDKLNKSRAFFFFFFKIQQIYMVYHLSTSTSSGLEHFVATFFKFRLVHKILSYRDLKTIWSIQMELILKPGIISIIPI